MRKLLATVMSVAMLTGTAAAREAGDTFAIQNVQTGKNIRPLRAKKADENQIIQYPHWSWKCMTWQFIETGESTYQLRNLWTSKTLQPSAANGTLWQKPLSNDPAQSWELIRSAGDTYLIKMKSADLYLSVTSTETNAPIVLQPLQNTDAQRWRMVAQNPWI